MSKKTDVSRHRSELPSRRDFLKTAGVLTGGIVFGIPLLSRAAEIGAKDLRSFTGGRVALELDGTTAGFLQSAEGGYGIGEVVTEPVGPDLIARKHLVGVRYEPITITCGTGLSKNFYSWIKETLDGKPTKKDGALITLDFDSKERSRLTFHKALITEVAFPALDGSSKDIAKMTIKFAPEFTRITAGTGAVSAPKADLKMEQRWLASNYRLRIQGLEQACTRVNKIQPLVVKRSVTQSTIGQPRDSGLEAAKMEVGNLGISLPEADAGPFYMWYDDFALKGNNGPDKEKQGVLEILGPNLKDVLFTVALHHLGVFKFGAEKVEAGSENIRRVKVEMYCEAMQFIDGPLSPSPSQPLRP